MRTKWDEFRNPVSKLIREPQGSRNVTHCAAGHHGAEGTYLCHVIIAIFLSRVIYYLVSPVVGDVHVDIWRRRAVWVKESLKRKFEIERVNGSDPCKVRNNRARYGTSGVSKNAVFISEAEKVGYY